MPSAKVLRPSTTAFTTSIRLDIIDTTATSSTTFTHCRYLLHHQLRSPTTTTLRRQRHHYDNAEFRTQSPSPQPTTTKAVVASPLPNVSWNNSGDYNFGSIKRAPSSPGLTRFKSLRRLSGGDAGDAALLAYLREIGQLDLLDNNQVAQCAECIRRLVKWDQIRKQIHMEDNNKNNHSEEIMLKKWIKKIGWKSSEREFVKELERCRKERDRLVSGNLKLVVCIAKKYAGNGMSLSDLIQEGSLGLIRAAEKFDHTKGFRFATYASWWIRQAVTRALQEKSRCIRLPVQVNLIAQKMGRVRKELASELGRRPTDDELARTLKITTTRLRYISRKAAETATLSLDLPVFSTGDQGGRRVTLGDMIENETETPEEAVTKNLLRDDIENVLGMLNPKEREVLRLRYGFDDGCVKNHEEIGSIYCVPSNRIRQIESRALRKLKHPTFNSCLKEYFKG